MTSHNAEVIAMLRERLAAETVRAEEAEREAAEMRDLVTGVPQLRRTIDRLHEQLTEARESIAILRDAHERAGRAERLAKAVIALDDWIVAKPEGLSLRDLSDPEYVRLRDAVTKARNEYRREARNG